MSSNASTRAQAYCIGQPTAQLAPKPIPFNRDPVSTDVRFPIGQQLLSPTNSIWELHSVVAGLANWVLLGSGTAGGINQVNGDSGSANPAAGVIDIVGTVADGLSFTGSGDTLTGAIAASSAIQRGTVELATNAETVTGSDSTRAVTAAGLTARLAAPGAIGGTTPAAGTFSKVNVTTGANTSAGTSAAMTAGAITISTSAVTASSIIFVSTNTIGGTAGVLSAPVGSIVAGVSFDIVSSSNTDTSTVNWWIIN